MSESNETLTRRPLVPLSDVESGIDQRIESFRSVENDDLLRSAIESLPHKQGMNIPLELVYRPHKILKGNECVNSRYVFANGSLIDEGGFSRIYHAYDRLVGEQIVAKVLNSEKIGINAGLEVLQEEAELMAILEHDNFLREHSVRIKDVGLASTNENGQDKPTIVIFEEYLDDNRYLPFSRLPQYDKRNPSRYGNTLSVLRQVATGVERLFLLGHYYDLKADNLLVAYPEYSLKILDFNSGYTDNVTPPEAERYFNSLISSKPNLRSLTYSFASLCVESLIGRPPYILEHNGQDIKPKDRLKYRSVGNKFNTHFARDFNHYKHTFTETQVANFNNIFDKAFSVNTEYRQASPTHLINEIADTLKQTDAAMAFWKPTDSG